MTDLMREIGMPGFDACEQLPKDRREWDERQVFGFVHCRSAKEAEAYSGFAQEVAYLVGVAARALSVSTDMYDEADRLYSSAGEACAPRTFDDLVRVAEPRWDCVRDAQRLTDAAGRLMSLYNRACFALGRRLVGVPDLHVRVGEHDLYKRGTEIRVV